MYRNAPVLDLILEPLLIIIAGTQSGGMFLSVGLKMKHVKLLILAVQKIVDNEGNNWAFTFTEAFFSNWKIVELLIILFR